MTPAQVPRCLQMIVCSWCTQIIGTKASVSPEPTHTICPACLDRVLPTAKEEQP